MSKYICLCGNSNMPKGMLDIAFREAFKDENEEDIQLAQEFIKRARERDKRAGGKVDESRLG